jgi:hypothetical protein
MKHLKLLTLLKSMVSRITRSGKWTDLCREWISKAGEKLLTYYDTDNNGYRTAKGDYMISVRGGNDEQL